MIRSSDERGRLAGGAAVAELDGCAVRVVDAARVAAVRDALPPEADLAGLVEVFTLLADRGRVRLLAALADGEMCVCDLAAAAGLSESAASHALRLLRAHRVVAVRRAGRIAYYRLADSHVRMLLDLALAHIADGPAPGGAAAGGQL